MTRLLFVADGPRDEASLPPLVRTILGVEIEAEFRAWRDIRVNRRMGVGGYPRKLLFATRVARNDGLSGVVAVVDADRQPVRQRLKELRDSRTTDRESNPPLPTAVGEARPNVDAWLLDDGVAVREALRLPAATRILPVSKTPDPKVVLNELIEKALELETNPIIDRHDLSVLSAIAGSVQAERCPNSESTGFDLFRKDLRDEFKSLLAR